MSFNKEISNLILKKRDIKENSIKNYLIVYKKTFEKAKIEKDKYTIKKLKDILTNPENVLNMLSNLSKDTIRNYTTAFVIFLDAIDEQELKNKYIELNKKLNNEIIEKLKNNNKSERQSKNWATMKELKDIVNNYKKELDLNKSLKKDELTKKEFNILQKYVLGSLYVGDPVNHPPVRNDYTMEIIDFKDYNKLSEKDKDNNNYLVNKNKSNKFFSFGNYKSKDTYGIKKIKLSEKINKIINIWLKYNKSKHLFLDSLGQPIKANGISKLLYKIFEPSGKKISSSLLRHIFVSETFPPQTEERQKIASNMMHSVEMQSGVYSKNDT